jgi:hypothetical protein
VKVLRHSEVKENEANRRLATVRQARKGLRSAAALQHRSSLVGGGAKWRITNLRQVAGAMSKWA